MTDQQILDPCEAVASMTELESPFSGTTIKLFKRTMFFILVFLLIMKIAIDNVLPNFFAVVLSFAALYILIEVLMGAFDFANSEMENGFFIVKSFLMFLLLIIITSFY